MFSKLSRRKQQLAVAGVIIVAGLLLGFRIMFWTRMLKETSFFDDTLVLQVSKFWKFWDLTNQNLTSADVAKRDNQVSGARENYILDEIIFLELKKKIEEEAALTNRR